MGNYVTGFAVYTMAMIGLLFFAMFVYKKFSVSSFSGKRKGFLQIEDAVGLSARKTLYVIKAGDERFLIVADLDRTTLISKLDSNQKEDNTFDEIDKSNEISQNIINNNDDE